jgi:hypothetical protein
MVTRDERSGRNRAVRRIQRAATALQCLVMLSLVGPVLVRAQQGSTISPANCVAPEAGDKSQTTLNEDFNRVRDRSFPDLSNKAVRTRTFESEADYFRTRVSISRFLLMRPMHYFVEMNPRIIVAGPPSPGFCAILAHELVHIKGMSRGNRVRLLGMVRLVSPGYTAKFERSADLEAIQRGYGEGLSAYREWVYQHIPPSALKRKRRNYFSPEEIAAILRLSEADPSLPAYWKKHVPLNLQQILDSPAANHEKQNN